MDTSFIYGDESAFWNSPNSVKNVSNTHEKFTSAARFINSLVVQPRCKQPHNNSISKEMFTASAFLNFLEVFGCQEGGYIFKKSLMAARISTLYFVKHSEDYHLNNSQSETN